jgi:hypothetical protein
MKNIVFKPMDLIKRAFEVEQYSVVIVDEWDDAHYWSELGMSMRQFFRKCRQLNLFIILIIPNFFQMPMSYAVSRSVFFVDVRFEGKFERGYFRFFNFDKKKDLYIYGKKTQNYECVRPNFIGRFTKGYCVDEAQYKRAKRDDMIEAETQDKKPTEIQIKAKMIIQFREAHPEISIEDLGKTFGVHERTIRRWIDKGKLIDKPENDELGRADTYINNINNNQDNLGDGGLEEDEPPI